MTVNSEFVATVVPHGFKYYKLGGLKQQKVILSQLLEDGSIKSFSLSRNQGVDGSVLPLETYRKISSLPLPASGGAASIA